MMATFDYGRSRAVAERLIAKFGTTGAIRRSTTSGPDYDPEITETDYACTLVTLEIDLSKVDGTLIQASDRMAYVSTAGLSIDLSTADEIVVEGKAHAIKVVRPLNPAGLTVYWEVIFVA